MANETETHGTGFLALVLVVTACAINEFASIATIFFA